MLDGHSNVDHYAARAKELGMVAAAQTDHGNIHGLLDFYDACKKIDIKPILGLEAYQARKSRFDRDEEERAGRAKNEWEQRGPYHLTILAKNMDGYNNLIKLSSRAYTEGFYVKPRVDHELISEHANGLIILSGCLGGEVQQALLRNDFHTALKHAATMQEIVGKENYFIEVQDHGLEEQRRIKSQTLEIARLIGAKVVCTGDCHYVNKDDAYYHDVMLCAGTKSTIHQEDRFRFAGPEFYLKSYDEMIQTFEPEWLENSLLITEMTNVELEFGELHFPESIDVPEHINVDDHLETLVWAGLKDRYGDPLPDDVVERANHELGVVKRMGFQHYFLVVSDIVSWAKNNGVRVGAGRGSAAGSILSYALRITNLDPIKFGLLFERFLVEGRKSMPDIDLDFDDQNRDRVIDYVKAKYGDDRVANICTFSTLGARSAIRDAARALGHEYKVGDSIANLVPPPILGVSKTLDETMQLNEMKIKYNNDPIVREIIDAARGLEGIHRQPGIHAAGIVISKKPLTEYVPVMKKGEGAPLVTQWDMTRVEQIGLLKIDFLGLRNLSVVDTAERLINDRHGTNLDVDELDLDDQFVYGNLSSGHSIGVFQVESRGMREMMQSMQPDCLDDIMALISLYRPGPLGSGMDKIYINRKHGREKVSYPHPKLKEALSKSRGVMLYQEDVINVVRELAGFSASEADDLRKIIGKKQMDKIPLYRKKFVEGCKTNSNVSEAVANKIYSDIEFFAGYGFNRAHAASYAVLSYVTAWLKYYYPTEYMAALLTSVASKKDRLPGYLNECRRLDIEVMPPSVLDSQADFGVLDDNKIIFGLSAVDGIGEAIMEAILLDRESSSNLWEFMRKCDLAVLNRGTLKHLVYSGAFDDLSLQSETVNRSKKLELLDIEKGELGLYVTDHPLFGIWDYIGPQISHQIADMENVSSGEIVSLGGFVTKVYPIITRNNQLMYRLSFEDTTGSIEIIVFPLNAGQIKEAEIEEGSIVIVSGRLTAEGDPDNPTYKIMMDTIEKLDLNVITGTKPIVLCSDTKLSISQIKRMHDIIENVHGDSIVFLEFPEGNNKVTLRFEKKTSPSVEDALNEVLRYSMLEMEF